MRMWDFWPDPFRLSRHILDLSRYMRVGWMNQKLENLLQFALQTPEETRERTEDLNVGFDEETRTWELIVKYHGSLELLEVLGVRVEYLIAGYAILTVPQELVEAVAGLEEIEYVEKPKRYFYGVTDPVTDSCIVQAAGRDFFLSGKGVLIAVLDSGIDYRLPEFRTGEGKTRILYLWDQTLGAEYSAEQIDSALAETDPRQQFLSLPSVDTSGHGTAVAGIAAGYSTDAGYGIGGGAAGGGSVAGGTVTYRGVAPDAQLLIVKLGQPDALGFPRTTQIMRGVTWALKKAEELRMPLVINLSFGNNYGAHDGSSLIERFLDSAAETGRTAICVGSGNEGAGGGHLAGSLLNGQGAQSGAAPRTEINAGFPGAGGSALAGQGNRNAVPETATAELAVGDYERSLNVQLWKNYSDVYRITLRSPGGQEEVLSERLGGGKYTLTLEQTEVLVYIGEPTPYGAAQEIYLEFLPLGRLYLNSGVWTFRLEPVKVVTGNYYFYLPSASVRNERTGFYRSTPDVTLTIPSTAARVITVGAYDSLYDAYADFSGRGYTDSERTVGVVTSGLAKPDIVAPGVGILAPDIYGGYTPVTGTSFSTPIVAGSAALLMEWGIVRGNDPFLYGEKLKAYLQRGARPLRGESIYPNPKTGWGALCVQESIPG